MGSHINNLPSFSQIKVDGFAQALKNRLNHNREQIKHLLGQSSFSWDNLMEPLEQLDDDVHHLFSPLAHMNAVVNDDALRNAYQEAVTQLSAYGTELGQNETLYHAIKSIDANKNQLDPAQQMVISNDLLEFHLSGVSLDEEKKTRFKAIQNRLSELSTQFENNLLDATNAWSMHLEDEHRLAGLPQHAVATAKQLARAKDLEGWVLSLDFPCYHAVQTYAQDSALREEMYHAFVTRASELGPHGGQWDNTPIIDEMLALRHEKAELLGFANYAELSLSKKMADKPQQVLSFLHDLAKRSRQQAHEEMADLQNYAKTQHDVSNLNPWDVAFYSEKLRQFRYQLSQEDLRPYFPEDIVLQGMFGIVQQLYGIELKEVSNVDTWHQDVRFFELYDENNTLRGGLYIDLYARAHKRGGAWMDECIVRRRLTDGSLQVPVAFLTCNFAPPSDTHPALFSHDEVLTLFHEFGHCLHHLLTKIDYAGVSGINGVEWDAVELPSQFFENWCWHKESLFNISRHYQTGESLPEALYEKLMDSRNYHSAMQMVRQLEFALFDFRLHLEFNPNHEGQLNAILEEVRDEVSVVPIASYNRFANSFSHIFAGGYAAGYYSYKWAEVLSSDAFSRFEEEGLMNAKVGRDFMHQVLEQGGSRPAMESFIAFRKREPKIDALLRHLGIAA